MGAHACRGAGGSRQGRRRVGGLPPVFPSHFQALDIQGDIPMLSRHFGAILHGLWSSAASESTAATALPRGSDDTTEQCEEDDPFDFDEDDRPPRRSTPAGLSGRSPRDLPGIAGPGAREEAAMAIGGLDPVSLNFSEAGDGRPGGDGSGAPSSTAGVLPSPRGTGASAADEGGSSALHHSASEPAVAGGIGPSSGRASVGHDAADARRLSMAVDALDIRKPSVADSLDSRRQSDFDMRRMSVASSASTGRRGSLRTDRSVSMSSVGHFASSRNLRPDIAVRETRAQHAAAARNAASFEVSRRVRRYLQSDDLRIEMSLHLSAMSIPGMAMTGLSDEPSIEGSPLDKRPQQPHAILIDISGIGVSGQDGVLVPGGVAVPLRRGQRAKATASRQVLVLQVSSVAPKRPSLIPAPGSGLLASIAATPAMATPQKTSARAVMGAVQGPAVEATVLADAQAPLPATSAVVVSTAEPLEEATTASDAVVEPPAVSRDDAATGPSVVVAPSAADPGSTSAAVLPAVVPSVDVVNAPTSVSSLPPPPSRMIDNGVKKAPVQAPVQTKASGVTRFFAAASKAFLPPPTIAQMLPPAGPGAHHKSDSRDSAADLVVAAAALAPIVPAGASLATVVAPPGDSAPPRSPSSSAPTPAGGFPPRTGAVTAGVTSASPAVTKHAAGSAAGGSGALRVHDTASAPPPALCIDFQLSVLSLLEDVSAVSSAIDVVSQLQQAAAPS